MIIPVHMLAYGDGAVRNVAIPDEPSEVVLVGGGISEEQTLENAFAYGQNEVCPLPLPSVSVGDVVELDGFHLVLPCGFRRMPGDEFARYKSMDALERIRYARQH